MSRVRRGSWLRAADRGRSRAMMASGDAGEETWKCHLPPVLGSGGAAAGLALEFLLVFGDEGVHQIWDS